MIDILDVVEFHDGYQLLVQLLNIFYNHRNEQNIKQICYMYLNIALLGYRFSVV